MTGKAFTTAAAMAAVLAVAGCHAGSTTAGGHETESAAAIPAALRLVAFTSCDAVVEGLNHAAAAAVGPYGLPGGAVAYATDKTVPQPALGARNAPSTGEAATPYSGTNVQEPGVDEPDLVKTDGHRIVTVKAGVLRVIDAASGKQTGSLILTGGPAGTSYRFGSGSILLSGDHALVISGPWGPVYRELAQPLPLSGPKGPHLTLVDLSGTPSILATYDIDGGYVDARQVGSVARVVIRSSPRIEFPGSAKGTDAQRIAANRKAISRLGVNDWLPRFTTTSGGKTTSGHVPCDQVQRPADYSGTSMLTVLSFDLSSAALGDGDPTTIVADGGTVYATADSLYVASDQRWLAVPMTGPELPVPNDAPQAAPGAVSGAAPGTAAPGIAAPGIAAPGIAAPGIAATASPPSDSGIATDASHGAGAKASSGGTASGKAPMPVRPTTPPTVKPRSEIYRFDLTGSGPPRFVGAGEVPGFLLNSYAMSDWNGYLRVAVTTGNPWGVQSGQESAVYVLSTAGHVLRTVGHVGGLGHDQRIYGVRFAGPVGYVVTYRQIDPLYTLDLSDPARPTVTGQLEMRGYSAYLHPIDATHLIGIGQDANSAGRATGVQVSIFDVSDPAHPRRTAHTVIASSSSMVEFDPHAFLYWAATGSVVIPVSTYQGRQEAIEFRVSGGTISKVGTIRHPGNGRYAPMERAFVVGTNLWTLSTAGLMASNIDTLRQVAWVPLTP